MNENDNGNDNSYYNGNNNGNIQNNHRTAVNETKIKLGIASCLLGEKVRYNGGHTLDRFLVDILGKYVQYVPVCPEVEMGLPVPREAMRLVGSPENPRLVTQKTNIDYTDRMKTWAKERLDQLEKEHLCGYIFKSKSPSSGMERVKVYDDGGTARRNGVGMFARAFMERFPLMPVEDEGRLNDIILREDFIVRVFNYYRWRKVLNGPHSIGAVVDFHSRSKLLFMAYSQDIAKKMGALTARAKEMDIDEFFRQYESLMMSCMKYKSTPLKNANVLYHMIGYFKKDLQHEEKQELVELVEHYRHEYYPLIVPLTLLKHYVRKYNKPYLQQQYYLNPHPLELKLRNHA